VVVNPLINPFPFSSPVFLLLPPLTPLFKYSHDPTVPDTFLPLLNFEKGIFYTCSWLFWWKFSIGISKHIFDVLAFFVVIPSSGAEK
jgi:hypothetical protein